MITTAVREAMQELIRYLKLKHYDFTTPTPLTHHRVIGRPNAETLRDAFGWNRSFRSNLLPSVLLKKLISEGLIVQRAGLYHSLVRASRVDGDLFLHSGYPTSESDAVFLGPDTYRFCRLIRQIAVSRRQPVRRAVDIGCGTGAGGVAAACSFDCDDMTFSDISDRALAFCSSNVSEAGLRNARVVKSDLFAALDEDYDLIVANPPYLNDAFQRAYRHGGGPLGSELSVRIVRESLDRLSPGGMLVLYTGSPIVEGVDHLRAEIEVVLAKAAARWSYEEIDPDVFGEELELERYERVERIAVVALIVTKNEGT